MKSPKIPGLAATTSEGPINAYIVDGTYELFRHHFALPSHLDATGVEVAGTRGVLGSVLMLLEAGVTHLGVATDGVVASFRNDLWSGYKTDEGIDPELHGQFPLLEEALDALGVTVWSMEELEADDAMATAAFIASSDPLVGQVVICTPDKDLCQCVSGARVVQFDRRQEIVRDSDGVVEKFGVSPESIPDYLALVGDSADGFPGLPGWGPKSAATVLSKFVHLDAIPDDCAQWGLNVRGAQRLSETLSAERDLADLFKRLATLRTDAQVGEVSDWKWAGPRPEFAALSARLGAPRLYERASADADSR